MRILRITAENLASLAGLQHVDFTTEPLRSAGLFSIIGPTGSGKSTLLDALCLALYDDTPRLKLAPKGGEDIRGVSQQDPRGLLRRGAASGMAEVAFVGVDGNTWTAQWKVRRARNKAEGQLQAVTMALYRGNLQQGQEEQLEVGGKKTEVLAAIRERVGLTFEQFTRAVLLAQNEFSAFLKAKDDERATILEALTGMEVFRAVSKVVHVRAVDRAKELQRLQGLLEGQSPLSEAERTEAELQLEAARQDSAAAQRQKEDWQQQLQWYTVLEQRHVAVQQAQAQCDAARDADRQAEPDRRRLQITERIQQEAAGLVHASVAATERQQLADKELQQLNLSGSECYQQMLRARQVAAQAEQDEELLRQIHQGRETELRTAAGLDAELRLKQPQIARMAAEVESATAETVQAERALSSCQQSLQQHQTEQQRLQEVRQQYADLLPLAEQSEVWLQRLQDLRRSQQQLAEHQAQLQATQQELSEEQLLADRQLQQEQSAQRQLDELSEQLERARAELLQLDPAALEQSERVLQDELEQLRRLERVLQQVREKQAVVQTGDDRLRELTAELQTNEEQLLQTQRELPAAVLQLDAARLAAELLRSALDDHAERLRAALQHNQPCPVCGALEHPWHAQPPGIGVETLQRAEQQVRDLTAVDQHLRSTEQNLAGAIKFRQQRQSELRAELLQQRQQLESARQELHAVSESTAAALILQQPETQWQVTLQQTMQQLSDQMQRVRDQRQQVRQREISCRELERNQQQCLLQQRERQKQQSATQIRLSSLQGRRHTEQQQRDQQQREVQRQELLLEPLWQQLSAGQQEFAADADGFCTSLQQRWQQLKKLQIDLEQATRQLDVLSGQLPGLRQTSESARQLLQRRSQEQQAAQLELQQLQQQRSALLEGQTVDDVQRQQLLQREQAAAATAEARRQWHDAEKQKVSADAAIRIATSARDQRLVEAQEAATALSSWMQVCGQELGLMLDTAMLQRELAVPADDLVAERLRLQLLRDTVTRSEGQLDAAAEEYRKHQETTAPAVSAAGIQQALQDQEPLLRELQGRLQEAVYRLRLDDDVRRKNADVTRQLEQCREAAGPWLKLNELIGSADGKKFSLLAQQVTLDLLLQHANLQLRELASRYRLERLTESLNLAVVDQDLADERRSVHSLSGGETFLASLALALGLASLTSSRVRIESLFIDEGFGSLDEETLEVAMNALAHLQSQGRRVGIITHVERMKDAIPVQIRVQRTTGGASRIVLPQS